MDISIIAIYGASLSTVIAITGAVRWWHDRRPHIKTTLILGTLQLVPESPQKAMLLDGRANNPTPRDVILMAVNTGQRVVILGGLGLLLPNGSQFPLVPATSTSEIPYRLPADESFYTQWPAHDFARRLIAAGFTGTAQVRGYYLDQRGRLYRSKPFGFDLNAWGAQDGAQEAVNRPRNRPR